MPRALTAAEGVLQKAHADQPDLPELYAAFGDLRRLQGRYDDAIRELLKAVQSDPTNHVFQKALGDVYATVKQDSDAAAAYERVIALQPRYWAGYLNYAYLHYNRGRYDEAARLIEQLIQWTPDHAQALAALGGVYVAMGRERRRRERFAAIVLAQTHSARATSTLASRCNGSAGRRKRSPRTRARLRLVSPNTMLFLNLADAHAYAGRNVEARNYFQRAIASAEERLRINLQDSRNARFSRFASPRLMKLRARSLRSSKRCSICRTTGRSEDMRC
jgi:tetratricopeptide (TPR) repeat protein